MEHHSVETMDVHLVESTVEKMATLTVLHLVQYLASHSAAYLVVYWDRSRDIDLVEMKVFPMEH